MDEEVPRALVDLPSLSRAFDEATGDLVWTLRIPRAMVMQPGRPEHVKLRFAAWMLRLSATALEDLP